MTIMKYEALLYENNEGHVTITINRPQALNAINKTVMTELNTFFGTDYKSVDGLKSVIITGAGDKAFVAGADIKEFATLDAAGGSALSKYGQDTYFLIENFHVPVIAVVNGFALGGGCELAMACHMRIASSNAKFGQPEVNLGLIPGYGASQRLPQLIGKSRAMELLLTADMIKADEAKNIGLINHIAETKADALDLAGTILKKIATKGPLAVAKTIQAVNAYYAEPEKGYEIEHQEFGVCIASDDCKEGSLAFVEKRRAVFTGK